MEKELSHYLQKFAIQSQLSKRCASYPTLPYNISDIRWIYRVGQKKCNTFQRQFLSIGKRYENETLTTYKERFDKLYDIGLI